MCWHKTIANGWTTTHRMHEPITWSCIFGCTDGQDELSHYISCPILLSVVHECFSTPFGPTVLDRLCIRSPSPQAAIMITTCFSIYHTLKGGHREIIMEAFRCHRFASVLRLARDIGIDCFHKYKQHFTGREIRERFSTLRTDSSLSEVAPGVFMNVSDPYLDASAALPDEIDVCRRQR